MSTKNNWGFKYINEFLVSISSTIIAVSLINLSSVGYKEIVSFFLTHEKISNMHQFESIN